jgi:peptidyl-prolyl cis-trans isomerase C
VSKRELPGIMGKQINFPNIKQWPGILLIPVTAFLLLLSATETGAVEMEPLVVVNGDTIMVADLMQLLSEAHQQQTAAEKSSFNYHNLINKLINDRLILQDAFALGMDEELAADMEQFRRNIARKMYIKEQFQPDIDVSQQELQQVFREMYWRLQIRTVSVGSRQEAERLIEDIRNGASMDSIARAISYDSRRFKGGLHNMKLWADVINEFRDHARDMEPGVISPPFPMRDAFTFLRVEDRAEADMAEFEILSRRIRRDLMTEKRDKAWQEFLDDLALEYPLQVDSTLFNAIRMDSLSLFTPEFMHGTDAAVFSYDSNFLITETQLRQEISYNAMQAGNNSFESHFQVSTEKLVQGLLLFCGTRDEGYMTEPEVEAVWLEELYERLINLYLEEMISSRVVFNRAEFDEYYQEHEADFREPDEVKLEEIHLSEEDQIENVRSRLQGGADFGFIQNLYSTPDTKRQFSAEWLSIDIFPVTIRTELASLKRGGHCGPFQIDDGWLFVSIRDMRPGRLKTLAEVDMNIRQVMFQLKFNELVETHLQLLKDNSQIIYFEDKIEDLLGNE